jgi:hypothetical protein
MRRLLLSVTVAAAVLVGPGVARGQSAVGDIVEGKQVVPGFGNSFFIDASSGPAGESPRGTIGMHFGGGFGTSYDLDVTCLSVSGKTAIIGFAGKVTDGISGEQSPTAGLIKVVDAGGPGSGLDTFEWASGGTVGPTTCSSFPGVFRFPSSVPVSTDPGVDIVVRDDGPAQPPRRMVGKGSVPSRPAGGPTASYAFILNCDPTPNTGRPFEVRFGTQRFRLTSTSRARCVKDFFGGGSQTGNGTGTLTSGGPGTIEWFFRDGGAGGVDDGTVITIKNSAGTTVFNGDAAPPGPFPGSTQPTGYNTFQSIP